MTQRAMATRRDELEEFKRRINLTQYAATLGYQLDRKASSRNSAVMKHPAGDKIIVAKGEDGHWIYFSVHNDADSGSIIDFIQRREAGSLGDVRKKLRPWSGGSMPADIPRTSAEVFAADLDHIRKDLVAVRIQYERMHPIDSHHAFLESERKIPWHILTDPLFIDRIRVDHRQNAIFPHYNRDGLCGYEIKNKGFTGFASGAVKGLWFSQMGKEDRRLVITETAIDALSYAALKYQPNSRYVSTAGELNPDQPILLKQAMEKLPGGSEIVLALDNDAGGDQIGSKIEAIFAMVKRNDLTLKYDRPAMFDTDWNDVLRAPSIATTAKPLPILKPRPPR